MSLANAEFKNSTNDINFQCSYLDGMKASMSMEGPFNHEHADCAQCLAISSIDKLSETTTPKTTFSIFMSDVPYISFVSKITTPPPTI